MRYIIGMVIFHIFLAGLCLISGNTLGLWVSIAVVHLHIIAAKIILEIRKEQPND